MPEHNKAPSLVIMVGSAKPSPWAKEGPLDDRDEDNLGHDEESGNAQEKQNETDDNTLIHLFHGLKNRNQSALNLCMSLAKCLQSMANAAHQGNHNALRHWVREADDVCQQIDDLGGHDE
jgi:hypothetical protein